MSKMRLQLILDAIDKSKPGMNSFDGNVRRSSGAVSRLRGTVSALSVAFGGLSLGVLAKQIFNTGMEWEGLNSAMLSAAGGADAAKAELAFAREEAYRLGLDLETSTKGLIKLHAASKGTVLQGQATRDIFSALAESSTVLNLSAYDTAGALRAVEQIMSKGTVQAEELRGQLGERIPGAFQMAARAMGVTTAGLNKMLEQGEVLSTDFLPKFAAELRRTYGDALPAATEKARASTNRLSSAWSELTRTLAESGLMEAAKLHIDVLTEAVDRLRRAIRETDEERLEGLRRELAHTLETLAQGEKTSPWLRWTYGIDGLREKAVELRKEISALQGVVDKTKPLASGKKTPSGEAKETPAEKKARLKRTRGYVKSGNDVADDPWLQQMKDRDRIIDSEYAVLAEKERELQDERDLLWTESTTNWEQQLKDREAVTDRHNEAISEKTNAVNQEMTEFGIQAARNIQDAFADYLFDPFESSLGGMLESFGKMLQKMAAQAASQQILSGLFGGLASSDNSFLSGLGGMFVNKKHSGGPISTGDRPMLVPRYHLGGLMPDEIPIVAQTGERMMSREQNKTFERLAAIIDGSGGYAGNGGGLEVHVHNNGDNKVTAKQSQGPGGKSILDIVIETVENGMNQGRFDRPMGTNFGVSRAGTQR